MKLIKIGGSYVNPELVTTLASTGPNHTQIFNLGEHRPVVNIPIDKVAEIINDA